MEHPTAEELVAEQAIAHAPKEEEIRVKVISDFGFDETVDTERIDKLVSERMESHKKLSDTIRQKIKHRNDAEELRKNPPKEVKEPQLSTRDIVALTKVPEEDHDEVQAMALRLGKNLYETLQDPATKVILSVRAEERVSANATQTKGARGVHQTTGDDLNLRAEQGNLPESDADIEKMVDARLEAKRKK